MNSSFALLLLALLVAGASSIHVEHVCGYEYLQKHKPGLFRKPRVLEQGDLRWDNATNGTRHTAYVRRSFRMNFDLSHLDQYLANNTQYKTLGEMSKRILARITTYLGTYMTVVSNDAFATGGYLYCNGHSYPPFTSYSDYVCHVWPEYNSNVTYFAAASNFFVFGDSRPAFGEYYLNFAFMKSNMLSEHKYFHIFLHEVTHLLGFNYNAFFTFKKPDGTTYPSAEVMTTTVKDGVTFKQLIFPSLLAYARSFYGCQSIDGVPLENGGGSGSENSHWEKLFMPNEYMNPSTDEYPVISRFTIEVLRSSGWYDFNAGAEQDYNWGKGSGCDFYRVCPRNYAQGYCPNTESGWSYCSPDFASKAVCGYLSTFYDNSCTVVMNQQTVCEQAMTKDPYTNTNPTEFFGPGSRCFQWNISGYLSKFARCHRATCVNGNKISIIVEGKGTYNCTSAGQIITVTSTEKIVCPNPITYCDVESRKCPADCYTNGRGICMANNTCFCFKGKDSTGKCNLDPYYEGTATVTTTTTTTTTIDATSQTTTSDSPTTGGQTTSSQGTPSPTPSTTAGTPTKQDTTTGSSSTVTMFTSLLLFLSLAALL